ncbi:hypothetical protein ZOSMA_914G00020 [Zostera marina]|uniref:Uncharacterized protein n=1 Tax=Zostera marina TaxID=29655 RepID=A0A0K9NLH2_ZOSMR|nr:hypothetical protein ZOSMA_914G00020 [Zostera marina]
MLVANVLVPPYPISLSKTLRSPRRETHLASSTSVRGYTIDKLPSARPSSTPYTSCSSSQEV